MLKVLIPMITVAVAFLAALKSQRVPAFESYLLFLIMSDAMAVRFFFQITTAGSWLDIGSSALCTPLVSMGTQVVTILPLALADVFTSALPIERQNPQRRSQIKARVDSINPSVVSILASTSSLYERLEPSVPDPMSYSNPAPPGHGGDRAPLATNDDFRRMLADRETQMKARAAGEGRVREVDDEEEECVADDRRRDDRRWGRMRTEIARRSAASERTMMWWADARDSKSRAGRSPRDGGGGGGGERRRRTRTDDDIRRRWGVRKRSLEESKYLGADVERTIW